MITHRLGLLKRYRQQKRTTDLMYLLREGLSYDIANIAHPMLFTATYVGTKKIIEDYIEEVSLGLAFVASTRNQLKNVSAKKLLLLNATKRNWRVNQYVLLAFTKINL